MTEITHIADVETPDCTLALHMGELSLYASDDIPGPEGDQALS
ncbi:MAG: hypothetical protein OXH79_16060 [Boseongicola sp.]|nr:hypothetical protein [Boseongicola sp.]